MCLVPFLSHFFLLPFSPVITVLCPVSWDDCLAHEQSFASYYFIRGNTFLSRAPLAESHIFEK